MSLTLQLLGLDHHILFIGPINRNFTLFPCSPMSQIITQALLHYCRLILSSGHCDAEEGVVSARLIMYCSSIFFGTLSIGVSSTVASTHVNFGVLIPQSNSCGEFYALLQLSSFLLLSFS